MLGNSYYYPLKTYKDLKDVDILASVLGQIAKLPKTQAIALQLCISPAGNSWQRKGASVIAAGVPDASSTTGRTKSHPHSRTIEQKLAQVGFSTAFRLLCVGQTESEAEGLLSSVAGTLGVYALGEGNAF